MTTGCSCGCNEVLADLGYVCSANPDGSFRVWSPFCYPGDGERIGVFVKQRGDGWEITDRADTLMHLSSRGMDLSAEDMECVRARLLHVTLEAGGALTCVCDRANRGRSVSRVIAAALTVSHFAFWTQP